MTLVPKNPAMTNRARELRREMTPQEHHLWYDFLKDSPVKIYKQRVIESFIADFYCASALLVIEIDGSQHFTPQGLAYDQDRSAILQTYGIQVLRFSNHEVDTQFPAVCDMIHHTIQTRRESIRLIPDQTCRKRPFQSASKLAASFPQGGAFDDEGGTFHDPLPCH